MTCSGRNLLSCSCYCNGAHSLLLADNAFHVFGFLHQDNTGVFKLDAVTHVCAVHGHG
jgi:hypothetical protein